MNTVCFLFFCWLVPGVVPDGAGGFVPFTNSRVMPDGSLRPYDPVLDGLHPAYDAPLPYQYAPPPQGIVTVGPPEPYEPPGAYYDPPPQRPAYHAPSRPGHHADGKACYDSRGQFVGADNEDCRHDPNPPPLPDSREWVEPE